MPTTYTLIQDNREKKPLPFPRRIDLLCPEWPAKFSVAKVDIDVKRARVPEADYLIAQYPDLINPDVVTMEGFSKSIIIERKASVLELANNLLATSHRRARLREILTVMREGWAYPVLLVEGGLSSLYNPKGAHVLPHPPRAVVDALMRVCFEAGVILELVPSGIGKQRYLLGEHVARRLINGKITHGNHY